MIRVGIIGVTGYTGMELVRLLSRHPGAEVTYASSLSSVGKELRELVPGGRAHSQVLVETFDPARAWEMAEFFFLCLPHGQSMETAGVLYEKGARIVDLSADFRMPDPAQYEIWYSEHRKINLLSEAVYGLPEIYRDRIRDARLVANPGCYPTSIILGLAPFLRNGLVGADGIVADSKSGVSGAGREPRANLHFPEVSGNFQAYSLAGTHRHTGEIEQELGSLAGSPVRVVFSPHLLPVTRGILSTIYALPVDPLDDETVFRVLLDAFEREPFIRIHPPGEGLPSIKEVNGTNTCSLGARVDGRTGSLIVVSCIDNLVKGAAGQAVQNMNLMTGQEETTGLLYSPLYP
jgi:N-acetyl-gamma-glutamyl-phosphate reductase